MSRNICRSLSIEYSQKLLDHAKKITDATDALKTASNRPIIKKKQQQQKQLVI